MQSLQAAQESGSKESLEQLTVELESVKGIFDKALEIEPNGNTQTFHAYIHAYSAPVASISHLLSNLILGLDALAQLGQYFTLLGDLPNALIYLQKALNNARTLSEVGEHTTAAYSHQL